MSPAGDFWQRRGVASRHRAGGHRGVTERREQTLPGIIHAKTQVPPQRSGLVDRTKLVDDLEASEATVVLVRAPAGYGKSTVLEQWSMHSVRRFAWVSLDPSEGDPVLFWRYVYAALRSCVPGFAPHLHEELAKPGPDLDGSVIPGILNQVTTIGDPLVIVLDDYHRIDSPDVDRTMRRFLRHLPRGTTVAVATRSRPDLETARLRSMGLVHDLDASTLGLTLDETASVLASLRPRRTADEVEWIHEATEGWPAGVFLFGLLESVDTSARTTSDIRQYLIAEMFSSLSPDDLRFMRDTSVLSYLEGGMCDHVTQGDFGRERLARLADSNLLVMSIDQTGERFRYHHLLRAELESLLHHDEPPDAVASLHRRALEWTEHHGDISAAIQHAHRAGDLEKAISLVSEHWYDYIMSGRAQTARQWLSEFADNDLRGRPRLTMAAAMISAFAGATAQTRTYAAIAEGADHVEVGLSGATTYESSVSIMRAAIAADGPASALADAQHAATIEPTDGSWRPAISAMVGAYAFYTSTGTTEDSIEQLLEGARAATGPPEIAAYALGTLALLHAWRNDDGTALDYAFRAIATIDETNVGGLLLYGLPYAVAANLSIDIDGPIACRRLLRRAEQAERAATDSTPLDSMILRTAMAEAYLELEEYTRARACAQRALGNLAAMEEGGLVANRLTAVIRRINASAPDIEGQRAPSESLLSPRELQVLTLLAAGGTLEDTGRRLYISRNTTKTYAARIYRKLGVSGRNDAVATARRLGLLA